MTAQTVNPVHSEGSVDDRILALITEREEKARKYPEFADRYDNPAVRRSIANSVAILRAAGTGQAYGALINTANNWWPHHDGPVRHTPEDSAAFTCEHFPWSALPAADLADAIAAHIEASAADLLDDGATAAAWRTYARELRAGVSA